MLKKYSLNLKKQNKKIVLAHGTLFVAFSEKNTVTVGSVTADQFNWKRHHILKIYLEKKC